MNRIQRILALLALTVLIVLPMPAPADYWICGMICSGNVECSGPAQECYQCQSGQRPNGSQYCVSYCGCECDDSCGGSGGGECFDDPGCIFNQY